MNKRILVVDDDRVFRLIVNKILTSTKHDFEITEAANAEECLDILQEQTFDAILLDFELGETNGIQMINAILARQHQYTPIIMISAHNDDERMYSSLQHGAQDYLVKDEVDRRNLLRSIRYAEERSEIMRKMEQLANFDSLTGLANRASFLNRLNKICETTENSATLFFIDIDDFKPINDSFGHEAGDLVLKEVGKRLKKSVRQHDFVARLGGDEFAIVFLSAEGISDIGKRADYLLSSITHPLNFKNAVLKISCSIGSSNFPIDAKEPEDLIRKADKAMYEAKKQGKNAWCAYKNGQITGINVSDTTAITNVSGTPMRTKSINV